ncbi:MAG: HDOD domain-containing protein [candidate division KSB1 bacterium]|nr:HDOD domain-containing protein [candidate division KSB1 bacterium]MDQ7065635.1 HDOD domain-containing protein [candidate division KSB1 bacterium]
MNVQEIRQVLLKIKQLPTLPQVVMHLLKLIDNPASSVNQVSKIISQDQSLATKVLKLVNSPFYGMSKRIATLSQATVILGFNTIKNLALTTAIFDQLGNCENPQEHCGFSREKFWQHSVACAVAAKTIAEHIRYEMPEEAFMAGLIHDIGKVVFDQFLHEEFMQALDFAYKHKVPLFEGEQHAIGAQHTDIGAWLGEKWNLPSHLIATIEFHHSLQNPEKYGEIVAIVHLANVLVRLEGFGHSGDPSQPIISEDIWHLININPDNVPQLLEEIRIGFENAKEFLRMVIG